jgi:glycerophosphoryl diester phosphodiesterase
MAALGIEAINLHADDWNGEWIATFQRHGRRAFAWDLQEEPELTRLVGLGVDAVYSDHVDRMMRSLAAAAAPSALNRR